MVKETWGYAIRPEMNMVNFEWDEVGFSTREEAVKKGKEHYLSDPMIENNFFLCVGKEREYLFRLDVQDILEKVKDEVVIMCPSVQDDFLEVSDEAITELDEQLNQVFQAWLVKQGQNGKAKELLDLTWL